MCASGLRLGSRAPGPQTECNRYQDHVAGMGLLLRIHRPARHQEKKGDPNPQALIDAATYPVMMVPIIDDRSKKEDPIVNGLFVDYT